MRSGAMTASAGHAKTRIGSGATRVSSGRRRTVGVTSTDESQTRPDGVERRIVAELRADGRITTIALAQKLGVSEVTARRNLRRPLDRGWFSHGDVDHFLSGVKPLALTGEKVHRTLIDDVAQELCRHPTVRYVIAATGTFHLLVDIMAMPNQELGIILLERS